jgi:hypothetical protein
LMIILKLMSRQPSYTQPILVLNANDTALLYTLLVRKKAGLHQVEMSSNRRISVRHPIHVQIYALMCDKCDFRHMRQDLTSSEEVQMLCFASST